MTKELEKRLYLKASLLGFVIVVISLIFGFSKFAMGIIIGTITSIINFKLLAVRTNIITSSKKTPNPFFIIASFFFRLFIMGAVLWVAINKGIAVFLGAAVGLFMVIIAIYIDNFLRGKQHVTPDSGNSN